MQTKLYSDQLMLGKKVLLIVNPTRAIPKGLTFGLCLYIFYVCIYTVHVFVFQAGPKKTHHGYIIINTNNYSTYMAP